jgi:threonine/homoserine/homoserine lactone efflux protein
VGVFLLVGIATIVFALRNKTARKPLVLSNNLDRFLLGLSMSALNPIQIPFWFAWSTFFIERGWMRATPLENNIFSIGCGLGTLAGLALYMYGGHWLVTKLHASQRTLNLIMGGVFLFAAAAPWPPAAVLAPSKLQGRSGQDCWAAAKTKKSARVGGTAPS